MAGRTLRPTLQGVVGVNGIGSLYMVGSTVVGNGAHGLLTAKARVVDSTITGNGGGPEQCLGPVFHFPPCVDIWRGEARFVARGVECGTSYDETTDQPTGLCSGD